MDQPPEADPAAVDGHSTPLWLFFLVRTVINTSYRVIYPFLPTIARGLGVSLAVAGGLVTLRLVAGLSAPILGLLTDRYGRRRAMEAALLLFVVASLLLAGLGNLPAAAVAFALYGVVKALYDPALYAYLGDAIPYERRGRAIGLIEFSWSGAWLLGVPAAGWVIARLGWRAPWAALAALGVIGAALTRWGLPAVHHPATAGRQRQALTMILGNWRRLLGQRAVLVLLLVALLFTLANEIPFIVYGAWLESAFGLSLTHLGLASIVVGLAEAGAEVGAALLSDRLGKRRSVLIGLAGLALTLVALPWMARLGLLPALLTFALSVMAFEFSIVSYLPLATELAPQARASLLSLLVTAFNLSRILGAWTGSWLWRWQNLTVHAAAGVVCALVAALLLIRGLPDND